MWYFFFSPRRVWLCAAAFDPQSRGVRRSRCPEKGGRRLPRKKSSQSHSGLLALYSHLPLIPQVYHAEAFRTLERFSEGGSTKAEAEPLA
jgi:hypothetical protein